MPNGWYRIEALPSADIDAFDGEDADESDDEVYDSDSSDESDDEGGEGVTESTADSDSSSAGSSLPKIGSTDSSYSSDFSSDSESSGPCGLVTVSDSSSESFSTSNSDSDTTSDSDSSSSCECVNHRHGQPRIPDPGSPESDDEESSKEPPGLVDTLGQTSEDESSDDEREDKSKEASVKALDVQAQLKREKVHRLHANLGHSSSKKMRMVLTIQSMMGLKPKDVSLQQKCEVCAVANPRRKAHLMNKESRGEKYFCSHMSKCRQHR